MYTRDLKQILMTMIGFLIVGGACSLNGCAVLRSISGYVETPAGQVVLNDLADVAVGWAEQHGMTAGQINVVATQLKNVDFSTPTTLATAVPMIQAHGANVPVVDQTKLTLLTSAIGVAVNALHGADAQVAKTTTADILAALVTASSVNPNASGSRPITQVQHKMRRHA